MGCPTALFNWCSLLIRTAIVPAPGERTDRANVKA